jgi:hypothetical protein
MFYKMIGVRVVQKRGIVAPLLRGIVALLFWSQPQATGPCHYPRKYTINVYTLIVYLRG